MATPRFVRARLWHFSIFVTSACLWLGSAGRAGAGSITYTTTVDTMFQGGFVPYFDPSFGVLNTVIVDATGSFDVLVSVDSPVTSLAVGGFVGLIALPDSTQISFGGQGVGATFNFDPPFVGLFDAPFSFNFEDTIASGLDPLLSPVGIYNIQIFGNFGVSEGQIFREGGAGTVTVTYVFSLVPEPSSAILLALGLVSVLIINVYKASSLGPRVIGHPPSARRP